MTATRVEYDSLGSVNVLADRLWRTKTRRSLKHVSFSDDISRVNQIKESHQVPTSTHVMSDQDRFNADLLAVLRSQVPEWAA